MNIKIPVAMRVTISDFRDMVRPPLMRTGELFENLMRAFRENIAAGADLVAIESTGGKEVSDRAVVEVDIQRAVVCVRGSGTTGICTIFGLA